jgi:aryl-alcohol dehydrogenase-like predicted oxidoreductase
MRLQSFGAHTGLRVSELVLGTANFGQRWGHGADLAASRQMLDQYLDAGGNFVDTADVYQFGQSEEFLGELLEGRRDNVVLATKFTQGARPNAGVLATGNSRLAMRLTVEASLKRLRTDRIDLLWVHMPDGLTPMEEIMQGLDELTRSGKIVYAGLSNFPAWRAARGATIAELRGSTRIAGLQFEHSLVQRTSEHELLPAGRALGLGLLGWSPLGGGLLSGKYRQGEQGRLEALGGAVFQKENSTQRTAVVDATLAIAGELGVPPAAVAVAWVLSKGVLPLIGPRTVEQLTAYLAATQIVFSAAQAARLEEASAIMAIFPNTFNETAAGRALSAGGQAARLAPASGPVA